MQIYNFPVSLIAYASNEIRIPYSQCNIVGVTALMSVTISVRKSIIVNHLDHFRRQFCACTFIALHSTHHSGELKL